MEQKKRSKVYIYIILIILLLLLLGCLIAYLILSHRNNNIIFSIRDVSDTQSEIDLNHNHHKNEEAYTELMGFGCLDIDESYPFIYLINPDSNEVYLSFDVYENDNLLYNSNLIEPGKMEGFNVFESLDAGKHSLTYSIASYNLQNKAVLWSGIKQNQEINIYK